jgi:hypothetical protein
MENIRQTDCMKNKEVLHRVKGERNIITVYLVWNLILQTQKFKYVLLVM